VARKIEAALELLAKLGACGELDSDPFGRDGAHPRWLVLSRKARREENLDFTFGFPTNGFEQVDVIFLGQVRPQQRKRRQMELAGSDERVNDGKLPPESRGSETTKCFALLR
jgi:hypothetical protein